MADTVPQKRILPARERRESAAKRRDVSPVPSPVVTPKKPTPTKGPTPKSAPEAPRVKRKYTKRASLIVPPDRQRSSPASDIILPTKVNDARPLPTSCSKQPENLSVNDYQSIAESAILATALHRSRVQWLCDGVFERYWTKPVKRKGITEAMPNNPDAKSMQKLGSCTVTIEPHVFEAVFYTVKEAQGPLVSYHPPLPVQLAPPHGSTYLGPPPGPQQIQSSPTAAGPPPKIKQEAYESSHLDGPSSAAPSRPLRESPNQRPPRDARPLSPDQKADPPPPSSPKSNTDPVIQMLASRAATDPNLKDLMKVVATSKASAEQLKEFQRHIDEFNAIIKQQESQKVRRTSDAQRKTIEANQNSLPQIEGPVPTPTMHRPALTAAHPATYSSPILQPQPMSIRGGPSNTPQPQPPSYPPYGPPTLAPPRLEPRIKHIVLEFTTPASATQPASQDRWLFPEFAVLEIPPAAGGFEMLCSFFVERQGSDLAARQAQAQIQQPGDLPTTSSSMKWDPKKSYYDPVTIKLRAMQHRTLRTIATAARTLPDVQKYMEEVIKKKTRAPSEVLVLRLPREKPLDGVTGAGAGESGVSGDRDSGIDVDSEEVDDELRDFYGNG